MTQLPPPAPERPSGAEGAGTPASNTRRRKVARVLLLAVLLALLIGVFAAVRGNGSPTPVGNGATSTRTASTLSPGGQTPSSSLLTAPDFTLPTLSGPTFHLAAKQGHVVVLYFMAPTCPSCVPDSHTLADTLLSIKQYGVEALAIDVNLLDQPSDLEAFIHSEGISAAAPMQWGIDTTGAITSAYGVLTLETTVIIDRQGQIANQTNGAFPPDQLAQIIRSLA